MAPVLREGGRVPEVEGADHTGARWRLVDQRGRWVVIFFYPRDGSPVCTAQACAFRDATPRLLAMGVSVVGVSPDGSASHGAFAAEHGLGYPLLSDEDGSIAKALGVRRALLGLLPGRETVVIDPNGMLAGRYRAALAGKGHAAFALARVEAGPPKGGELERE